MARDYEVERRQLKAGWAVWSSAQAIGLIDDYLKLQQRIRDLEAMVASGVDSDPPFDPVEYSDCFEKTDSMTIMQEAHELGLFRGRIQGRTESQQRVRELQGKIQTLVTVWDETDGDEQPMSDAIATARAGKEECETCQGKGTIDETLGGIPQANPETPCPDCAAEPT